MALGRKLQKAERSNGRDGKASKGLLLEALGGGLKYSMGRLGEDEEQMQGTSEMSQIRRPENAQ